MNSKTLYYDVEVLPPAAKEDHLIEKHSQQLEESNILESTYLWEVLRKTVHDSDIPRFLAIT